MLDNNVVHPITYTAKAAQKAYREAEHAFKFELEEPQKVVDYFGIKLVVPGKGWVAVNNDHLIFWHETEPEVYAYQFWTGDLEMFLVGKLKSTPNPNWWKESLIEV